MTPKIAGCCSKCDVEVFAVLKRDPVTRRPLKLGGALDTAVRVAFILADGSEMGLTFCRDCSDALTTSDYAWLWRRVMHSWIAQSGPEHPWARSQVDNAILGIRHSRTWKEVASHG